MASQVTAKGTGVGSPGYERPGIQHDNPVEPLGKQQDLHDDGDGESISFKSMHVTPVKLAKTSDTRKSKHTKPFTGWTCCDCKQTNDAALSPERCPVCSHRRCSACYEIPMQIARNGVGRLL